MILKTLVADPPHALLLTGARGIGKLAAAESWAHQITGRSSLTIVEPNEKGTIGIEQIRELYNATKTSRTERQVVIIRDAAGMGQDAQNALLKLLEEPRSGVHFVLTCDDTNLLLPTILSRVQNVQLLSIADNILAQSAAGVDEATLRQALFIANGRPELFKQLIASDESMAKHSETMKQAKAIMAATRYERLCMINKLSKDRETLVDILEALSRMVQLMLVRDPSDKWVRSADLLQDTLSAIKQNGNLRAQLTKLFMVY